MRIGQRDGLQRRAQRPIIGLAPFVIEATKADNAVPRRANLNCSGYVALRHTLDANGITPELLRMTASDFHSKLSNLERSLAAVTMSIGCSVGVAQ